MKERELISCPRCAAVYREGYRMRELDSGAAERRECEQCGRGGYFPRYELGKDKKK